MVVSGRPFDLSDGLTVPVLELTAGDYTLIVETLATGIEPFSFRLLDRCSNRSNLRCYG